MFSQLVRGLAAEWKKAMHISCMHRYNVIVRVATAAGLLLLNSD